MNYKFNEDKLIMSIKEYIDSTYSSYYHSGKTITCFDKWIDRNPEIADNTFLNVAEKYIDRYGKKGGKNTIDLLKAIHYIMMAMYMNEYYKTEEKIVKFNPNSDDYDIDEVALRSPKQYKR